MNDIHSLKPALPLFWGHGVIFVFKKGEKFSTQNIIIKGPAGGLMPKFVNIILNRKSVTKIEKDEPITWKSF